MPWYLPLPGQVGYHHGFRIVKQFEFDEVIAAACAVGAVGTAQHQPSAPCWLTLRNWRIKCLVAGHLPLRSCCTPALANGAHAALQLLLALHQVAACPGTSNTVSRTAPPSQLVGCALCHGRLHGCELAPAGTSNSPSQRCAGPVVGEPLPEQQWECPGGLVNAGLSSGPGDTIVFFTTDPVVGKVQAGVIAVRQGESWRPFCASRGAHQHAEGNEDRASQ